MGYVHLALYLASAYLSPVTCEVEMTRIVVSIELLCYRTFANPIFSN